MTNLGKIYKKRDRQHVYEHEIQIILEKCEQTRFALRNKLLILTAYNHALRASETCNLKWNHIDLINRTISITRLKNGRSGKHPIYSSLELELLKEHHAKRDKKDIYVFMSENVRPKTQYDPFTFNDLCEKLGIAAGFDFKLTPHMLRHAKITQLIEDGIHLMVVRNYAGHTKVSSTERYTHLSAKQYDGINNGSIFC